MPDKYVIIERETDGAEYAVLESNFRANSAGRYNGFKGTRYEDGSAYHAESPAAESDPPRQPGQVLPSTPTQSQDNPEMVPSQPADTAPPPAFDQTPDAAHEEQAPS